MVHHNNPRAFHSPGEEDVAAGSQNQQCARRWLATSQRRKCVQPTSEWQGRGQSRSLQGDQQEGGSGTWLGGVSLISVTDGCY